MARTLAARRLRADPTPGLTADVRCAGRRWREPTAWQLPHANSVCTVSRLAIAQAEDAVIYARAIFKCVEGFVGTVALTWKLSGLALTAYPT